MHTYVNYVQTVRVLHVNLRRAIYYPNVCYAILHSTLVLMLLTADTEGLFKVNKLQILRHIQILLLKLMNSASVSMKKK